MADDHAPIDCLTGPNQRLNALRKLEVSKARANRGALRAMFVGSPAGEKPAAKGVVAPNRTPQQLKPRSPLLVPSL
jgi:hypothetical protein